MITLTLDLFIILNYFDYFIISWITAVSYTHLDVYKRQPFGPCDPVAPVAPFKLVNAKLNTFAVFEPDAVTVTEGVPTVLVLSLIHI